MSDFKVVDINENDMDEPVYTRKIGKLEESVEEMKLKIEELNNSEDKLINEDINIQEKNWLEERARLQREAEDTYRRELIEKQRLLDERRKSQADSFYENRRLQYYNRMHELEQEELVYSLHGMSPDKVEGMREYKNAIYQGGSVILFLAGLIMVIYSYFAYGIDSHITLLGLALVAADAALLPNESDLKTGAYRVLCRILSILPVPMLAVLISEASIPVLLEVPLIEIAGGMVVVLSIVSAAGFFFRNPYRKSKSANRKAVNDIKNLKKTASRNVKKNMKIRKKLELSLQKKKERQENRLEKLRIKEQNKIEDKKRKEEEKARKIAIKIQLENERHVRLEELLAVKKVTREKYKELYSGKIINFKDRIAGMWNKEEKADADDTKSLTSENEVKIDENVSKKKKAN